MWGNCNWEKFRESIGNGESLPTLPHLFEEHESEDLMDRCDVISLDELKTVGVAIYVMEEDFFEADELDYLSDTTRYTEDALDRLFRLRKVGV